MTRGRSPGPKALASDAELAAILDVHSGASSARAARKHGVSTIRVDYLIRERVGSTAALRALANATELEVLRHQPIKPGDFWRRVAHVQPEPVAARSEGATQSSPFPPLADFHHDAPASRVHAYRTGVGPFRHRDLTGAILGDPPLGRSALDRRSAPRRWDDPPKARPARYEPDRFATHPDAGRRFA